PPATAYPSTTATVGLARLNARPQIRADTCAISTELLVVPRKSASSIFRSAPAQNVCPRPRTSTTRTSGSRSACSSASPNCCSSAQFTQFFTSGRFSQIVATRSATSYCTNSGPVRTGSGCRSTLIASPSVMPLLLSALCLPAPRNWLFPELISNHIRLGGGPQPRPL